MCLSCRFRAPQIAQPPLPFRTWNCISQVGLYNRGLFLADSLRDIGQATQHWERLIAQNPKHTNARRRLGMLAYLCQMSSGPSTSVCLCPGRIAATNRDFKAADAHYHAALRSCETPDSDFLQEVIATMLEAPRNAKALNLAEKLKRR